MKKLIILSVLLLVLSACNNKDSNNSAIDKIEKKYDANVGMYALNTKTVKNYHLMKINALLTRLH